MPFNLLFALGIAGGGEHHRAHSNAVHSPSVTFPPLNTYRAKDNPYVKMTSAEQTVWQKRKEKFMEHKTFVQEKFGSYYGSLYCVEEADEVDKQKYVPKWGELHAPPVKRSATVPCTDSFINTTNWDLEHISFCRKLNKDYPMPLPSPEVQALLDLNYAGRLDPETGDIKDAPPSFDSGSPKYGLKFDPSVVKDTILKLRAALLMHYGGEEEYMEQEFSPKPGEDEYTQYAEALSDLFARKLVHGHGGKFVLGGVGDSTMSAQDNCYFDNYIDAIGRQLRPIFVSMGIDLETRNTGHNGKCGGRRTLANYKTRCVGSSVGTDADLVIVGFPYVKPSESELEDMIRRSLVSGVMLHIGDGKLQVVKNYAKFGVGLGGNQPKDVADFFPKIKNGHWRRAMGFFCREETRAGSAPVWMRNWHSGPLNLEYWSDFYVYRWSAMILTALDRIIAVGKGGQSPKSVWAPKPQRPSLPNSVLNSSVKAGEPSWCEKNLDEFPALCAKDGAERGLMTCGYFLGPIFGHNGPLNDWIRDEDLNGTGWTKSQLGTCSNGGATCQPGKCDIGYIKESKDFFSQVLNLVKDTPRSSQACDHRDKFSFMSCKKDCSKLVVRIPEDALKYGSIILCGTGIPDNVVFNIKGDGFAKSLRGLTKTRAGLPDCSYVVKNIEKGAMGKPLAMEITNLNEKSSIFLVIVD